MLTLSKNTFTGISRWVFAQLSGYVAKPSWHIKLSTTPLLSKTEKKIGILVSKKHVYLKYLIDLVIPYLSKSSTILFFWLFLSAYEYIQPLFKTKFVSVAALIEKGDLQVSGDSEVTFQR